MKNDIVDLTIANNVEPVAESVPTEVKAPDYSKIHLKRGCKSAAAKQKDLNTTRKKDAGQRGSKHKINDSVSIYSTHLKPTGNEVPPSQTDQEAKNLIALRPQRLRDSNISLTIPNQSSVYSSVVSLGSNRSLRYPLREFSMSMDVFRPRRSARSDSKRSEKMPGAVALPRDKNSKALQRPRDDIEERDEYSFTEEQFMQQYNQDQSGGRPKQGNAQGGAN
jgi:hypothetical protein